MKKWTFGVDLGGTEIKFGLFDNQLKKHWSIPTNRQDTRTDEMVVEAKNMAKKASRIRKNVALEPMNPYERRIIHSALQDDKYVTTHSEGDEPYRRVVITPKKTY